MQDAKDVVGQYRCFPGFLRLSLFALMVGFFARMIPSALALGDPGKSIIAMLSNRRQGQGVEVIQSASLRELFGELAKRVVKAHG